MRRTFQDPEFEQQLSTAGFCVVPFLDPDQVAVVEETYWRLGPAPGDLRMTCHFDFQSESIPYKESVDAALRTVVEPMIDGLLDNHRLINPNFIMKWPGPRSGFAPHQDITLVEEDRFRSVTIWCPLTDTVDADGRDNGVLYFVPGSHDFVPSLRAHDPGTFAFAGRESDIVERYGIPVPIKAGEAIVFDHRVVHFSMPNSAAAPRLVLGMGLRPAEADIFHFRRVDEDRFDVYGIDDEFFVRMNPFLLREGVPGYSRVDQITFRRPEVTAEQFDRWCTTAGGRRPDPQPPTARRGAKVNAKPFCFRCGTQRGLIGESGEHGNLQLLCGRCAARALGAEVPDAPDLDARMLGRTSPIAARSVAAQVERDGFAVVDVPLDVVAELRSFYEATRPDDLEGFRATIQTHEPAHRREVHQGVRERVEGLVAQLFVPGSQTTAGNFVVKQPGPWVVEAHQDFDFLDETQFVAVTCWLPLHDVDVEGSSLQVVPGSHRLPTLPRGSGDHRFPFHPVADHLMRHGSIGVDLRAGQALVYDSRTLHWSAANQRGTERVAAAFATIPPGAQLLHKHVNPDDTVVVLAIDDEVYADTPFHGFPVRGTVVGVEPLPSVPAYDVGLVDDLLARTGAPYPERPRWLTTDRSRTDWARAGWIGVAECGSFGG